MRLHSLGGQGPLLPKFLEPIHAVVYVVFIFNGTGSAGQDTVNRRTTQGNAAINTWKPKTEQSNGSKLARPAAKHKPSTALQPPNQQLQQTQQQYQVCTLIIGSDDGKSHENYHKNRRLKPRHGTKTFG